MKKRIEVRHGDEYCTKISEIYDENAFFYEIYGKAAQGMQDIVRATGTFHHGSGSEDEGRSRPDGDNRSRASGAMKRGDLARYPNNFIAFCAGRGQGKTSAMISFSKALQNLGEGKKQKDFWKEGFDKNVFYVLDPIDPTMMSREDSILRIVISRMFECYDREEQRRRNRHNFSMENEPELLKEFRQCYRSLDVLQKGRDLQDCYDDLEYLAELGDSSHMKETFQRLVSRFLDMLFQGQNGKSHQFLVIQIDDADLNASNAYRIVEELRKYCVVPNVIILMATDLEQLELTVEKHFIEELEMLCKYKKGDRTVLEHCHKMMERYLDKLIPGARQIHLPLIDHFIKEHENELELCYYDERGRSHSGDYQDVLMQMIYKKTGLVLMKPSDYLHNLLPKSMRELTHMLAFLSDLEDIPFEDGAVSKLIQAWRWPPTKKDESMGLTEKNRTALEHGTAGLTEKNRNALELRRKNIDAFMLYLRHCWIKAALTEEQQAVVVPAMETTMDMMIRRLLSDLDAYREKKYGKIRKKRESTQYVDVIETLIRMKAMPDCTENYCLIYISATILTLNMQLLILRDLEEGLEFGRLKKFMGEDIFPSGTAKHFSDGLRYDRFNIERNFVPQLLMQGEKLDLAHVSTKTVAQLLLTAREDGDVTVIRLEGEPLGSQAAFLKIFRNCLDRITGTGEPAVITEVLAIISNWDLQYHIRKELDMAEKKYQTEEKVWIPYETWLVRQVGLMDDVYEKAWNALNCQDVPGTLKAAFSKEIPLLGAMAIGNQTYAGLWWQEVRQKLRTDLDAMEAILREAVLTSEGDGEEEDRRRKTITKLMQIQQVQLLFLGHGSSGEEFLSEKAIFHEGTTPQDVISCVTEIINSMGFAEESPPEELSVESGKLKESLDTVKDCRKKLEEIRLYDL